MTDLHFGCVDDAALKAVERYVRERKPDLVICTGDISKDGLAVELNDACAWLRSLEAPVMLTPGNHDVPYFEMWGRLAFPWKRFEAASKGIHTEAWHTPQWSIVPVNTARAWQFRLNWAQGEISRGQTAIAAAELQKAAPGALRIVITHHPLDWPNDAPIKGITRGGARGLLRLIDAGAELFLSGHLHFAYARLIETKALSIISGTLSKRLRHEPCAFTVIRRPAPHIIEAEVLHVVQGVAQTAAKRQFLLNTPPQPGAPGAVTALPGNGLAPASVDLS
ncbi:metallophosphoesterase family protein [Terricaulis sp.]|uniref:metallophosphoesterase family protein n=1 Tax=Terricaulis sp. TaxID=2768686 RepID=UPI003784C50E